MLSKIKLDSLENIKAKELLIRDNLLAKKENQNKNFAYYPSFYWAIICRCFSIPYK